MNIETLSAAQRLHSCLCMETDLTENERRLLGRLKKMLKLPTSKTVRAPLEQALRFERGMSAFEPVPALLYLPGPHYRGPCTLVDILESNAVPDPELVGKYYGPAAPKGAFRSSPNLRLVFAYELKGETRYCIVPHIPYNAQFYSLDRWPE